MKQAHVVLSAVLVCILLTATLIPMATVEGQSPPPEILGPGWHLATAGLVAPATARRVLSHGSGATPHAIAALPASETEATLEIEALARALEQDPGLIFDYVHNHIEYVPTFGSVNGATATLLAGRGNDWDQTSLFIALMRTAGYTANYVVGDATYTTARLANWLGVEPAAVDDALAQGGIPATALGGGYRITRIWAAAEIGGQTYVFDPAMKEHTEIAGIDMIAATGYDRSVFMAHAQEGAIVASDLVQDMNEPNVQADLTTYTMNLVDYIQAHVPDATLTQIVGGREIVMTEMTAYPTALPDALEVTNETTHATIPDGYRHTLRVEHEGIDQTFYTFQIAGQRISIFYDAGDNYRPLLRVDGETIATGDATASGGTYNLTLTVNHPYAADGGTYADQSGTIQLLSGSDYVLMHDFNTVSQDLIAWRNQLLTQYTHDGLAEESEPVRGEGLWLIALSHHYQEHLAADLLGPVGDISFIQHHTLGVLGQEATYFMDIFMALTSARSASTGTASQPGFRALALMGSALEHGVLEQTQGSDREAVSTVKLLRLNNAAGDLTFLADEENWGDVLPHLDNYHPAMISEIQARINAGRTLLLPQKGDMALNEWHGAGFVSYSAASAEMLIGGGLYGGSGTGPWDILISSLSELLKQLLGETRDEIETEIPDSDDPVDMYSGAFHLESVDLAAGPDGLLDLAFGRSYSSGSSYNLGPMGYGWRHNQQTSLAFHHDYEAGLGQRQPTDAAALIVFAQAILDVLEYEETIEGWMTADLATQWAMDQLIDNAVTVHFGSTTAEYVVLPDGSTNPPPGLHWGLVQNDDYHYAQGPENTCMIFDSQGRGRVWTDANGNTLTYTYDGEGRLLSVGNPGLGQSLTFTYTGDLLTSITDQAGRGVTFEYTDGELTTFRDAKGHAYHYAYDDAHHLVSVTRPEGNTVVINAYDDLGRVITQTDALSHTTTFSFSGYRNTEVRADGGRMTHFFDGRGRTTGNEDGQGNRTTMVYDGLGHLRTLTDRLGATVNYTYDPASGQLATLTDADGETLSYTYTAHPYTCTNPLNGEHVTLTAYPLTRVDYADGSFETLTYDELGNLRIHTDLGGHTWHYQYNARGQQIMVTNPTGGEKTTTYNADGTLASSTDSDLGVTTYGYDTYLRQDQITYPDGSSIQIQYDLNDRITLVTDPRGQTTTYEYDANGNLLRTTDPLGGETTTVYNLMDQVVEEIDPRGMTTRTTYDERNRTASVTDPNGNTTHYDYDTHGWVTLITDPEGHTLENEYDAEGLRTASTTPLSHTSSFQYDAQGRRLATVNPLGHASTLSRDAVGRVTASTDPEGRATRYTYDALGQMTAVRLPGGETVAYQYNGLGLLTNARDARGYEWQFTYSPMGQLQRRADPLGNQWTYTYNQHGRLAHVTHPTGEEQTLTYDAAGNLTRQQYSAGPDLSFTYDALNRIVATDGISMTYDAASQVIATTDTVSGITNRAAYDDGGRLEAVSYASGLFTVTYQYNARDLLTQVSDDLTGASVTFTYDDDGRLVGLERSNGVDAAYTWDAASRLTRIQDGALIDLQYTHNAAGDVTQAVMDLPLDPADPVVTDTVGYTFDAASQLSSPGFAYDARGRLVAAPGQTMSWDGASRLVGVNGVSLTYNGFGDVLTRTENGQTKCYLYNHALGLRPIVAERDVDAGAFQRFYVWTPSGALLYAIDAQAGDRVTFYHFDRSGSTLALTDEAGTLTDAYVYDPYGRLLHHQGSYTQPFTYVGQWGVRQEGGSGTLYQMRARTYDAVTGRFLSREPLWPQVGNAYALNPYQYAYQNPGTYVDVTGLMPTPVEYARWRISQAGESIDDEEAMRIERAVNQYANRWVVQNVGNPLEYELTPQQYGRFLMREAGPVIDEMEQLNIMLEMDDYTVEWLERNAEDGRLTPEQYLRWLMREAGPVIDEMEQLNIILEMDDYIEKWNKHQSEQKAIKQLGIKPPAHQPGPNIAPHPIRLGGYYSRMP